MSEVFRLRFKSGDFEVEVESSQQSYTDAKFRELLELELGKTNPPESAKTPNPRLASKTSRRKTAVNLPVDGSQDNSSDVIVAEIVDSIKNSPDFPAIEKNILKQKARIPRMLLCYYFAYKHAGDLALTNRDIESITDKLRVRIELPNVAKLIREGASKYLAAYKGTGAAKYRINTKGIDAFEKALRGEKWQ
jgi:hypothetical protein